VLLDQRVWGFDGEPFHVPSPSAQAKDNNKKNE
jgi:hypothetical protein